MTKRTRRNHSPAFKAKVALEALREQESVAEIARRYGLHANVVANWKRQLARERPAGVRAGRVPRRSRAGERAAEEDRGADGRAGFFSERARTAPMRARRGLIGPDERTSIRRQCELLGVSRSSVYYVPVEPDAEELGADAADRRAPPGVSRSTGAARSRASFATGAAR